MKRVSTGERVDLDALRHGIRQLMDVPDDEALGGNQEFVSQLMDTTPTSSFDETEEWRDGFVYDRSASFLVSGSGSSSPAASPLSAAPAAEPAAAAAAAPVVQHDDGPPPLVPVVPLFVKEPVAPRGRRSSLLAVGLQQRRRNSSADLPSLADALPPAAGGGGAGGGGGGGGGGPTRHAGHRRSRSNPISAEVMAGLAVPAPPAFKARDVVSVLVHTLRGLGAEGGGEWPPSLRAYELRMMDDDGSPDTDFPELDLGVAINAFGVEGFVLCEAGAPRRMVRMTLVRCCPEDVVLELRQPPQPSRIVITKDAVAIAGAALAEAERAPPPPPPAGASPQPSFVKWLPDSAVSKCMAAGCRTVFGLRWRTNRHKHHCRNCGNIFCSTHSSRRMLLPHLGYHDVQRVCDGCYDAYGNRTPPGSPARGAQPPMPPSPPGDSSPAPPAGRHEPPPLDLGSSAAAAGMVVRNLDTGEEFSLEEVERRVPGVVRPEELSPT